MWAHHPKGGTRGVGKVGTVVVNDSAECVVLDIRGKSELEYVELI